MGVELKRNVKEAWWHDMVTSHNELTAPSGAPAPYEIVGLDCTIIMHPQVWKVSGDHDLFVDQMVDCRETIAQEVYGALKAAGVTAFYDEKGAVGRRYRRRYPQRQDRHHARPRQPSAGTLNRP